LVRLPFNARLACLSPPDFVKDILVDQLQAQRISIGADFCFGYQRQGTAQDLKAIAQTYGIEVTITPLLSGEDAENFRCDRISSSRIREAIAIADLPAINQMLGRPYSLQGTVVQGRQLGRTIGFPTANLQLPSDKLLPRQGVYGVRVAQGTGFPDAGEHWIGVMNLGSRPTLAGQTVIAEVHLLDWEGDLYGQTLTVFLETFLRSEERFPSLDALKAQIAIDCQQARVFFAA
jgi:riboflavin kinase/FMN adenylyltransferase